MGFATSRYDRDVLSLLGKQIQILSKPVQIKHCSERWPQAPFGSSGMLSFRPLIPLSHFLAYQLLAILPHLHASETRTQSHGAYSPVSPLLVCSFLLNWYVFTSYHWPNPCDPVVWSKECQQNEQHTSKMKSILELRPRTPFNRDASTSTVLAHSPQKA
jgi:hypothetical protein